MSMKIKLHNIGVIGDSDIALDGLTVITGKNETTEPDETSDMLAGNSGNNTINASIGAEVYAENGNDTVYAAGHNFIGVNGASGNCVKSYSCK